MGPFRAVRARHRKGGAAASDIQQAQRQTEQESHQPQGRETPTSEAGELMKIPVFVVDQEGVLTDVFLTDRRPTVRSLDGQGEGRAESSQTEHQVPALATPPL
jgi:hypothetical protein